MISSISIDMRARLPAGLKAMTVKPILEAFEDKFIDTNEERQDELREVAPKMKMTRNRSVADYINKHINLWKDMITVGCKEIEIDNEKETIKHIINRLT